MLQDYALSKPLSTIKIEIFVQTYEDGVYSYNSGDVVQVVKGPRTGLLAYILRVCSWGVVCYAIVEGGTHRTYQCRFEEIRLAIPALELPLQEPLDVRNKAQ